MVKNANNSAKQSYTALLTDFSFRFLSLICIEQALILYLFYFPSDILPEFKRLLKSNFKAQIKNVESISLFNDIQIISVLFELCWN